MYSYNYCMSRSCEKECIFFKRTFSRPKCKLTIDNMIWFCEPKLSCEDCNLSKNYQCLAKEALKKFQKIKMSSEEL